MSIDDEKIEHAIRHDSFWSSQELEEDVDKESLLKALCCLDSCTDLEQRKSWRLTVCQYLLKANGGSDTEHRVKERDFALFSKLFVEHFGAKLTMGCSQCGAPAHKRCSQCSFTRYCSGECQRAHWPLHKSECGTKRMLYNIAQIRRQMAH